MADESVSSGADLSASFPSSAPASTSADTGASAPAQGADAAASSATPEFDLEEPASPDAPNGEEDINYDELNDQGNPDPDDAIVPAAEEVKPAEADVAKPAEAVAEELPEGVRKGKDRNGKDGYWLNPNRYETFHNAHKLIRDTEAMIGEPLTTAALDVRHRAFMGQEKLYSDMLSGDPALQANVIGHFFGEAKRAQDEGEISGNPMIPFTQQFYQTLRDSDPDSYATLRSQAASDLVDEMYLEAAQKGNRSLWLSAQHFDKILGREFKPETSMANMATGEGDQLQSLRAENDRLRNQVTDRSQKTQAAQFEEWRGGLNQNIGQALNQSAISPALAAVAPAYKDFPETFKSIQGSLHSKILDGFKADQGFKDRINLLLQNARRAPSAQKRSEFAQQIVNLHSNKARQIADAVKGPILAEAARGLKAQSDHTHQRREAAQKERAPSGGSAVRTSLAPTKSMDFEDATPGNLSRSLAGLFR